MHSSARLSGSLRHSQVRRAIYWTGIKQLDPGWTGCRVLGVGRWNVRFSRESSPNDIFAPFRRLEKEIGAFVALQGRARCNWVGSGLVPKWLSALPS